MKLFSLSLIMVFVVSLGQNNDLLLLRQLYARAALSKTAARQLQQRALTIDSNSAPLLYCYKGANEMIQAKHALNPMVKLEKFNRGKTWITAAIQRDTTDLEMRFIRFSVQSNLPVFLGYRDEVIGDKIFLLRHIKACQDTELKKMIVNYMTTAGSLTPAERKGLEH